VYVIVQGSFGGAAVAPPAGYLPRPSSGSQTTTAQTTNAETTNGRPLGRPIGPHRATTAVVVEMGGIEPPSIAVIPRLLRAQPVQAFCSAPTFATGTHVDRPSLKEVPHVAQATTRSKFPR